MGFSLTNDRDEYFGFNWGAWHSVLLWAHQGGWKPAGTQGTGILGDNPEEWDGGYTSNDCQLVADEDAAAIADGLENYLADIPGFPNEGHYLHEFVAFCRRGCFTIS